MYLLMFYYLLGHVKWPIDLKIPHDNNSSDSRLAYICPSNYVKYRIYICQAHYISYLRLRFFLILSRSALIKRLYYDAPEKNSFIVQDDIL